MNDQDAQLQVVFLKEYDSNYVYDCTNGCVCVECYFDLKICAEDSDE